MHRLEHRRQSQPGNASSLSGAAADPVSGRAWAVGNSTAGLGAAQQTLTEFNP